MCQWDSAGGCGDEACIDEYVEDKPHMMGELMCVKCMAR
jgi:hypothetical protein